MRRPPRSNAPVAELADVTRRYGEVLALDDVTLSLEPGRVTSILGPNGAGKSTAVKLMLGLLRPSSGKVRLLGGDPDDARSRMRVGTMLQVSGMPDTLRVRELVRLFQTYYPRPLPYGRLVELAGLEEIEERLFGKLSGGQKQRVAFALALCGDSELLFLDEPTAGLDVEARRRFWSGVRAQVDDGRSVVLTTHYLEEADALSDRILVLQRGRVRADGTPHQIKAQVAARRSRPRRGAARSGRRRLEGRKPLQLQRGISMDTAIDSQALPVGKDPARRSLLGIWLEESRCEILKTVRMPAYSLPTLAFPAVFYLMFGVIFGGGQSFGPAPAATYLLATYGAFGVMGVAFFGFGVGLAIERGQGWMLVKRASPMPIWAYFAAKKVMALLFALAVMALLVALGWRHSCPRTTTPSSLSAPSVRDRDGRLPSTSRCSSPSHWRRSRARPGAIGATKAGPGAESEGRRVASPLYHLR